jgi:hypothetical protein
MSLHLESRPELLPSSLPFSLPVIISHPSPSCTSLFNFVISRRPLAVPFYPFPAFLLSHSPRSYPHAPLLSLPPLPPHSLPPPYPSSPFHPQLLLLQRWLSATRRRRALRQRSQIVARRRVLGVKRVLFVAMRCRWMSALFWREKELQVETNRCVSCVLHFLHFLRFITCSFFSPFFHFFSVLILTSLFIPLCFIISFINSLLFSSYPLHS